MNITCMRDGHDFKKVYPDQDLIDSIIFIQDIGEIWVCCRCKKAQKRTGTVGTISSD